MEAVSWRSHPRHDEPEHQGHNRDGGCTERDWATSAESETPKEGDKERSSDHSMEAPQTKRQDPDCVPEGAIEEAEAETDEAPHGNQRRCKPGRKACIRNLCLS